MTAEVRFTVQGLPPSVNAMYPTGSDGRRHISAEGRYWHDLVATICMVQHIPAFPHKRTRLAVSLEFVGLSHARDLDNACKVHIDAVAAALGVDDRYVEKLTAERVPGDVQETRICLRVLEG